MGGKVMTEKRGRPISDIKMTILTVYLNEAQYAFLTRYAKETFRTKSEVCRLALHTLEKETKG
jgi:hypothetical protein